MQTKTPELWFWLPVVVQTLFAFHPKLSWFVFQDENMNWIFVWIFLILLKVIEVVHLVSTSKIIWFVVHCDLDNAPQHYLAFSFASLTFKVDIHWAKWNLRNLLMGSFITSNYFHLASSMYLMYLRLSSDRKENAQT